MDIKINNYIYMGTNSNKRHKLFCYKRLYLQGRAEEEAVKSRWNFRLARISHRDADEAW